METESREGRTREVERPARQWDGGPGGEADRAGVRAPIVALNPGNAGGAKGCRKVEPR